MLPSSNRFVDDAALYDYSEVATKTELTSEVPEDVQGDEGHHHEVDREQVGLSRVSCKKTISFFIVG